MVVLLVVCIIILLSPSNDFSNGNLIKENDFPLTERNQNAHNNTNVVSEAYVSTLNPVTIEHTASAFPTQTRSLRTDISLSPQYDVYLPSGVSGNLYSAICDGGYFQVGASGTSDFGSHSGTISWWGKWDNSAPHGRFWGQDSNFESRWASNRIVLDWGGDNTMFGSKTNWIEDHWYFFAITWDDFANTLAFYWGDSTTEPTLDSSLSTWTNSVVGLLIENRIMNSALRTDYVYGNVDDFRYYNVYRTAEDIRSDYNKTLGGTELGLTHYYKFENDLADSVGNDDLTPIGDCAISRDVYRDPTAWRGEQIDVSISEVRTLYAQNGTFDTGNPGTNEDWIGDGIYHPDGWLARREVLDFRGRQRTSYIEDDDDYILIENEGYALTSPDRYEHYNGTKIYWYQVIDNSDLNEEFLFDLKYFYQSGPIGNHFENIFTLRFDILNDSISLWNWSIDLVNISQRHVWFNTGPQLVNITNAPSSFEARLTMVISNSSAAIEILSNDPDLDGDSTNGQFISIHVDDLSLIGNNATDPEDVNLEVSTAGLGPFVVNGQPGSGSILLNYSYWEDSAIPLFFSCDRKVSFKCSAVVSTMSRHQESSFTTSLSEKGVSFSASTAYCVNLTFYTYIPSYAGAEHLGFTVYHPYDWENISVIDSFGMNKTTSILSQKGVDEIPIGVVTSVGWWTLKMNAPNYAKNFTTQWNHDGPFWEDCQVFHDGDSIRSNLTLGTDTDTPSTSGNISLTWYRPSGEVWYTEQDDVFAGSIFISSNLVFGSTNSSPGLWTTCARWTNGTEIAYTETSYELRHTLGIIAYAPEISTQVNESFIASVYIFDQDTGVSVLSNAIVKANWSGTEVSFNPNFAKEWWEVELDASGVAVGSHNLTIVAKMAFYEMTNCTITIQVKTLTTMTILSGQQVTVSPGTSFTSKVRFMYIDGTGIEGANISILSWTGPDGGLDYEIDGAINGEPGNYSISFSASVSGSYFITLLGSKADHTSAATSFYLIVKPASSEIEVEGIGPPESLFYNQTYTFILFYHSIDDTGISFASVNVTYNPVAIISWTDLGEGRYEFSVRVPMVGSYMIYLRFEKSGYEFSDTSFLLNIEEIETSLTPFGFDSTYYQGFAYDFMIYYNSSIDDGVENAEFSLSPSIRSMITESTQGLGWYNFSLIPMEGFWNVTCWLSKEGYKDQEYSFSLNTIKIPIILSDAYPLNQTCSRMENTVLTICIAPLCSVSRNFLTGVSAEFRIINPELEFNNIVEQGTFSESSGNYTANITIPPAGLYILYIILSKENYQTYQEEIVLNSEVNTEILFATTFRAGILGAFTFFALAISVQFGRKYYTKVSAQRALDLLSMKSRFDESKNLIGFLIIHRVTGLPAFSRVIKGGFEEAMLSSFISAISHFRSEFSMDEPFWKAIPITEMISVVQTEVFICAIITVENPTDRQRSKLEQISLQIGALFDHNESIINSIYSGIDPAQDFEEAISPVFDALFDISLLERYVGTKKNIPPHLMPVAETISKLDIEYGATPEVIIRELIVQGYPERQVYNIVLECIDNEYLIPGPRFIPSFDGDPPKD